MTLHEAKIPSAIVTGFIAVVMWLIDYYSETGWIAADGLLWLFLIFLGAGGL